MTPEQKIILDEVKDEWAKRWKWKNWADYSWKMGINDKMVSEIADAYAQRKNGLT